MAKIEDKVEKLEKDKDNKTEKTKYPPPTTPSGKDRNNIDKFDLDDEQLEYC